jgi:hypothetical protein
MLNLEQLISVLMDHRVIPDPIDHDLRPPKAGERPNGRRRLCGEAKRAEARAGV